MDEFCQPVRYSSDVGLSAAAPPYLVALTPPWSQSTECPFGENCYTSTPCTEELGYPDDYGLTEDENAGDGSCVPFEITIVADYWPKVSRT